MHGRITTAPPPAIPAPAICAPSDPFLQSSRMRGHGRHG
jgi:hypothetical protein